jgi:hypothetical protein
VKVSYLEKGEVLPLSSETGLLLLLGGNSLAGLHDDERETAW